MKQIMSDMKSGNIKSCYLVFGEEAYLRSSLKHAIRRGVVGEDTMNYTYLEGKDATIEAIMDVAETMPFFADKRLVLVENSGLFKKSSEKLADFLTEMPDTTCLAFIETAVDRKYKIYKKVASLGYVTECKRQSNAELKRWVARGIGKEGKKVQETTVEEFLIRTGDDMENIRQELEKLISYVGDREIVTLEDVETITTSQLNNRIFDMIDAIATRNQQKALDLYYDLLQLKEPPMKILSLIGRQFHGILQVKELREEGYSVDQIVDRTGFRNFVVKRYQGQASRFSKKELEEYVRMSVETDEAVKNGNLRDTLAAEMLIVTFSGSK